MIRWPGRAGAAIRKLFEPLQRIDVYVEDEDDEPFYRALLNRATQNQIEIARVFGLGGKQAVLDAAARHDHGKRRALFIVDGDLPWVRGEAPPAIVGLHQHQAYCVENLLICEQAISRVLAEEVVLTETEATSRLAFSEWREQILQPLVDLFAAFATANFFDASNRTVALGVGPLCSPCSHPKGTRLDRAKAAAERDRLLRQAEDIAGPREVERRFRETRERLHDLVDPLLGVSGKTFLLPLLGFQLIALGCKVRKRTLRMRLVASARLEQLAPLQQALEAAARGRLPS